MATLTHVDAPNPSERYTRVPAGAGADGIGKRCMGRDIAGVMGWQGATWLEREEREREERTDLQVTALVLRPGMVVADIGAGTGYLARRMAPAVMPGGKVLAVDVQPEMVAILKTAVRQSGLTQIQPSLGTEHDVKLPPSSVDLAIMVDVYHELAFAHEVMASIIRALKPGVSSCSSSPGPKTRRGRQRRAGIRRSTRANRRGAAGGVAQDHHPIDEAAHPSGGVGRRGGLDLRRPQRRRLGRGPHAQAAAGRAWPVARPFVPAVQSPHCAVGGSRSQPCGWRWLAEVAQFPGVLAYGASANEAMTKAEVLALRVLAEQLEHGEALPRDISISIPAAA